MAKKIKLRVKKEGDSRSAIAASIDKKYNQSQVDQDRRYAADVEKERSIRETNEKAGKTAIPQGKIADPKKFADTMAIGRSHAGSRNKDTALNNLATRKDSGEYNASPTPTGGTKKQMRQTKLRIRKNSASPQAKAAAKRAL